MRSKLDLNSYDISLFARKSANKVLILIATTLAANGYAQVNDTIKVDSNPLYQQDVERLHLLPVTFANQNVSDYTQTEVYVNHKKNNFARKQTSRETNRYGFSSQGLFTTKNDVKIFGAINLEKFSEKDVAFNLEDSRTDDTEVLAPHYYFVPRPSDWSNQQYKVFAGAVKSFGSFNVAAKASLTASKYARQVDPRPEISNRKLGGEIQVGYTFGEHQIFALAGYQRKDKDYSYYYSNSQLNNIAYPETYIRFNAGYGREVNKPYLNYSSGYFSRTSYKNVGGGYQYNAENTLISAHYNYQKNLENWYDDKFENDKFKRYQYQTIAHQGSLNVRQKLSDKLLRSSLSGFHSTSKNYDVKSFGTNYMNRQRNVTFDINLLKQNQQIVKYYIGAFAAYNQNRYMDQLGYVDQKMNSVTAGIYANRDIESKNNSKFNVGLAFNYYTAIKNELNYFNLSGITDNVLYTEVIAHDFIYNSMDKLDAKADVRYILPVKNNKNIVLYTQLRSIFALDKNRNQSINLNTDSTYQLNFGIQLNY